MRTLPTVPKQTLKGTFVEMKPSELRRIADRAEKELSDSENVAIWITDGVVFYFEKETKIHEAIESVPVFTEPPRRDLPL